MEKKNAVQMTHDLKPPIEALTELVSVAHEMSENITPENFPELRGALEKLSTMATTLSIYMNERYQENTEELAVFRARKTQGMAAHAQLVVLENDPLLIQTYRYFAQRKNKNITIYAKPEDLFANLDKHTKEVPICLDYDLEHAKNGIQIAEQLHDQGYQHLYLASGYDFARGTVPDYLKVLTDKKEIMSLV